MIAKKRFALNRIMAPGMGLVDFFAFAARVGLSKVELRNDIRDGRALDGLAAAEAARMAKDEGVEIISINALQKFNLAAARPKAKDELAKLIEICRAVSCPAVVLCPNNEASDRRSASEKATELLDSLAEFGPMFSGAGVLGYIEPLGFGISSLPSLVDASAAIKKSGFSCFRVLVDTFHNFIGPEGLSVFGSGIAPTDIGLVHVSGVEEKIPKGAFSDAHRVMPGPKDVMKSEAVVAALEKLGYKGDYSFEPFSAQVQSMSTDEMADAVKYSIEYLSIGGQYAE